jgi:hypothetical protein
LTHSVFKQDGKRRKARQLRQEKQSSTNNNVLEAHRKVEHRGLEPTYYELKKTVSNKKCEIVRVVTLIDIRSEGKYNWIKFF